VMNSVIFGGILYGEKRNQCTKEYKVDAVRLIVDESRPISGVARKLGVA
jgi:transposase-like protein